MLLLLRACLGRSTPTMSSISSYLVLATAAFSVTFLGFLLYSAFGLAACKAVAPFVGTIALVFCAAHCLDKANELEDAKAREAKGSTLPAGAPVAGAGVGGAGAGKAAKAASTLPKRRRVAD